MARHLSLALICLFACGLRAEVVLDLENGASIRGPLVLERQDHVYVDLGYELIEVPRKAIRKMHALAEDAVSGGEGLSLEADRLYQTRGTGAERSIRDWVKLLGEAVTLIQTPTGLGSGFMIHPEGYVVTNSHVISGEHRISVTVFRQSGGQMQRENYDNVRIVANSADLDLALLKIEGADSAAFTTVPIAAADRSVQEGQTVFAVGSPLGLDRTVSEGIVSLANRVIEGRLYLQTTTQINPGNSGGPLFNLRGEVVGVNNMKIASVGAEGLGFSISARVLRSFLDNLEAYAFDPRNPNSGFRYLTPPASMPEPESNPEQP